MTGIFPCTCKSEYQDKRYGPGLRVHNEAKSSKAAGWRCTVCGKVNGYGGQPPKVVKDATIQ